MKKTIPIVSILILTLGLFNSCTKENAGSSVSAVSEDDAVEAITMSVSGESSSFNQQSQDACVLANTNLLGWACGTEYNSTVTGSNLPGAAITWSFNLAWNWKLICSDVGLPQKINFNIGGTTSWDAPRMSSDNNGTAFFEFTGLGASYDEYTMNANYKRSGTNQSKVGEKNSFTSTTDITSTDIKISKTSHLITSGTAIVGITGKSSSGKSFEYNGTIVFHGNKTATLTMSGGHTFELSW